MKFTEELRAGEADSLGAQHDFAGILAQASSTEDHARNWLSDEYEAGFKNDITSLSYEQALQKHARKAANPLTPLPVTAEHIDRVAQLAAERLEMRRGQAEPSRAFVENETHSTQKLPFASEVTETVKVSGTKAVSITLRVSPQEALQLRERAAAAGLTLSAYIRSCTCEAELLRAQVKRALAEMRLAKDNPAVSPLKSGPRPWWGRMVMRG